MRGSKALTLVRKEDLLILQKTDKEKKADIERSHIYIGYKLLWIIQLFLQGKKPNADLHPI
jgi:hypothetical protein